MLLRGKGEVIQEIDTLRSQRLCRIAPDLLGGWNDTSQEGFYEKSLNLEKNIIARR